MQIPPSKCLQISLLSTSRKYPVLWKQTLGVKKKKTKDTNRMRDETTEGKALELENTFPFQNSTVQSIPSFRYFVLSPTSDTLRRISSYVLCETKREKLR